MGKKLLHNIILKLLFGVRNPFTQTSTFAESWSSLYYRVFSHFNLTCEPIWSSASSLRRCSLTLTWSAPVFSILDVVANDCFLEVVPAVVSVLWVTNFCVGHAAHSADVRLNPLLLVGRDSHRGQIDCQVFLEFVEAQNVSLQLCSNCLFLKCVFFFSSFTFKHGSKGELIRVKFVDAFS